jgi:hypothetical protein
MWPAELGQAQAALASVEHFERSSPKENAALVS